MENDSEESEMSISSTKNKKLTTMKVTFNKQSKDKYMSQERGGHRKYKRKNQDFASKTESISKI